jgi:hypothetical protein
VRSSLLWFLSAVVATLAYIDGPPPAHTGGFGEPTCHECHSSEPLNDAGGILRLDSLPSGGYTPGRVYRLQLLLTRPAMARGGFELSVRAADSSGGAKQAGALEPDDDRAKLAAAATPGPVQYLEHSRKGTDLAAPDTNRWWFRWRAPAAPGPVVFHVAANAANDDNSAFGDFIYTAAIRVPPAP